MYDSVRKESELYEPMRVWLECYLKERNPQAKVEVLDTHTRTLDGCLERLGILSQYPQTVGLDIQIDILGVVQKRQSSDLVFIEVKKDQLNLHDLGQLWAYCKLCDPREAFLLSPGGLGSLNKVLNNLFRQDILEFGSGKIIKKMRVGKWDVKRNSIDYGSLVPKSP